MIRLRLVRACLLGALLLSACEKPTVNVNLHGVNYTGDTFSYVVMDPMNPDQGSGGELIDPFGAGGTMCCATLPRKWRPGVKLEVRTTHWLKARPDGSLPEVRQVHVVDIPQYIDGKPGELWVLRNADESVSVVSSDVQPDHEKWPGKVKGWPLPSLEYQRERWELFRKHEEGGVELYLSLLAQLEKDPESRAKKSWEHSQQYYPAELSGFTGPNDPKYRDLLRREYEEGLERSHKLLKDVMDARP